MEEARGTAMAMLYGVTALGVLLHRCMHLGYLANSSRSALASCKSAVSKPSLNQP